MNTYCVPEAEDARPNDFFGHDERDICERCEKVMGARRPIKLFVNTATGPPATRRRILSVMLIGLFLSVSESPRKMMGD